MCLHVALCSILINLICNMPTFRKKKKCFDLLTPPQGPRVCVRKECACMGSMPHSHMVTNIGINKQSSSLIRLNFGRFTNQFK